MHYEDYDSKELIVFDVLNMISPIINNIRSPKKEDIIELRKLSGLNKTDFAKSLSLSYVHIHNIEKGESEFSKTLYLAAASVAMERLTQ